MDAPDQAAAAARRQGTECVESSRGARCDRGGRASRGPRGRAILVEPEIVTAEMLARLRRTSPSTLEHLPGETRADRGYWKGRPRRPPGRLLRHALPSRRRRVRADRPHPAEALGLGVWRYGFHGLLYSYLMEELGRVVGPAEAEAGDPGAPGSGASLAAREGDAWRRRWGLPRRLARMGTRCGDIDPGLVAFLAHAEGMTPEGFHRWRTTSRPPGGLGDHRRPARLLARREADLRGAEAIDLFCYSAKKGIGARARPRRPGHARLLGEGSARTRPRSAAASARVSDSSESPSTTGATPPASRA